MSIWNCKVVDIDKYLLILCFSDIPQFSDTLCDDHKCHKIKDPL